MKRFLARDELTVVILASLVIAVLIGISFFNSEINATEEAHLSKPKDLGNNLWSFPTDDDRTLSKWLGEFLKNNPDLEVISLTAKCGPMASGYLVYVRKKQSK